MILQFTENQFCQLCLSWNGCFLSAATNGLPAVPTESGLHPTFPCEALILGNLPSDNTTSPRMGRTLKIQSRRTSELSSLELSVFLKKVLPYFEALSYFYCMCECLICMCVCAPCECWVSAEAGRCRMLWSWAYDGRERPCGCWDLKLHPLREHLVS